MVQLNDALKREVAASAPRLVATGLSPGRDFGDTSLRDPETGLIYILPRPTPRQPIVDWTKVTDEDVAVITSTGEIVGDPRMLPTVETPMHLRIYEARPDAYAIIHTHGEWSSVFAAARRDVPTVTLDALETIGDEQVRCAAYAEIASDELGDAVVAALGQKCKSALLANHGGVSIGASMEEAFLVAHLVEKLCKQVIFATVLGSVVPITWHDFGGAPTYEQMVPREDLTPAT
jgi:L-fuculose-phosphate aldolase